MALGIEWLCSQRHEWGQANPACHITAGIVEIADLLDDIILARAESALVQGEYMIKHPHEDLQPISFRPPEFIDLEAQGRFFIVAQALDELGEAGGFRGHSLHELI